MIIGHAQTPTRAVLRSSCTEGWPGVGGDVVRKGDATRAVGSPRGPCACATRSSASAPRGQCQGGGGAGLHEGSLGYSAAVLQPTVDVTMQEGDTRPRCTKPQAAGASWAAGGSSCLVANKLSYLRAQQACHLVGGRHQLNCLNTASSQNAFACTTGFDARSQGVAQSISLELEIQDP